MCVLGGPCVWVAKGQPIKNQAISRHLLVIRNALDDLNGTFWWRRRNEIKTPQATKAEKAKKKEKRKRKAAAATDVDGCHHRRHQRHHQRDRRDDGRLGAGGGVVPGATLEPIAFSQSIRRAHSPPISSHYLVLF